EIYFRRRLDGMDPAVIGCYFLVIVLSVICGLSREHCNFVLAVLRSIICCFADEGRTLTVGEGLLKTLPKDSRTLFNHFDLDPRCRSFVCCPDCFALYDESSTYP
ncbi:hypothetical protein BJ138DRAFT_972811, partial [Hygrophoropsis aurantiaca]